MDYKFFIDPKMKSAKYLVYKCDCLPIEMMLTTERINARSIEDYNFCIEKHKSMNLIQIRLSSLRDNTSVFICTIDNSRFEHFKSEQSLYVTFEAFVNHITEMVEKCRQKQLNILLTVANNSTDSADTQTFVLQFYEKGTFKNLEHISLPIELAPYEVILFHINQTYAYSLEENRILLQKNSNFQQELAQKDEQIARLNGAINGLNVNLNDLEKTLKERYKEKFNRYEVEIKERNEEKKYQTQEFEKQIAAFKARVETLMQENYNLTEQLKTEQKHTTKLRNDGKKALNTIADLNKQLSQVDAERQTQTKALQKNGDTVGELHKQIGELEQKVALYKKQKQELLAEVEAERNICQIKKDGLKIASEDICNANAIIRKQAAEIDMLRKKVDLRTEVALRQERLIQTAGQGDGNLTNLIDKLNKTLKDANEQSKTTENRIQSIRDRTNFLENKYRDRIDDLYDQLCTLKQPKTFK